MSSRYKIDQAEVEKRLQMGKAADELNKMKQEMASANRAITISSTEDVPLENLSTVGMGDDEIYLNLCRSLQEFLEKLGEYAFSPSEMRRYFPNSKIKFIIGILKAIGMELEARYLMDVFKDRVKQTQWRQTPHDQSQAGAFWENHRTLDETRRNRDKIHVG